MTKALFAKELRETAGIVLLALAAHAYFVTSLIGIRLPPFAVGQGEIPFVSRSFVIWFGLISACLVVALGLRQSLGESFRGTYLLLLHRPASRRQLIGTKLLVGAGAYLVCSVLPILAYGWWAAAPGNHASPFEWSMTLPAWKIWLALVLVYLGSFLSGIRPARWFGTRLAPLAAVGLVVGLLQFVHWWSIFLAAVVALAAALVTSIFFVTQERDY